MLYLIEETGEGRIHIYLSGKEPSVRLTDERNFSNGEKTGQI